jgi:hypothetical protein
MPTTSAQIDVVCDIARRGNNQELVKHLSANQIDLSQKNTKGQTIFEYLTHITLGIDSKKSLDHPEVINTLLINGAKPITLQSLQGHYCMDVYEESPWMVSLILMTGVTKIDRATIIKEMRLTDGEVTNYTPRTVNEYVQKRVNRSASASNSTVDGSQQKQQHQEPQDMQDAQSPSAMGPK